MATLDGAPHESSGGQQRQLTLHSSHGGACMARDLTQVIRLVRVTEEPAEDTTTGAAEKQYCRIGAQGLAGCPHDEYKCTQNGNITSIVDGENWGHRVARVGQNRVGSGSSLVSGPLPPELTRTRLGKSRMFGETARLQGWPLRWACLRDVHVARRTVDIHPSCPHEHSALSCASCRH